VHSLKDLPAKDPKGLCLPAIFKREDCRDVLIGCAHIDDLTNGSKIGSCSPRRKDQLLALRADLNILPLRGNILTRLARWENGDFDAIVLAKAGLDRLSLHPEPSYILPTDLMLPASGQAALALQCRSDNHALIDILSQLNDEKTAICTRAERAVISNLGANCQSPIAVFARIIEPEVLQLSVVIGGGMPLLKESIRGKIDHAIALSEKISKILIDKGARSRLKHDH